MAQEVLEQPATTATNGTAATPLKMSFVEFLEWLDEDTHAELVNGEVVFIPPISDEHQDIAGFLYTSIRTFVEAHDLGKVFYDPFQMKVAQGFNSRAPDILFVAKEHLSRLKGSYLDGPADLVIEIVSPGAISNKRDYVDKFKEYQAGGVPEYWIVDFTTQRAEFNVLGEDARYRKVAIGDDGIYRSQVLPGLWLRLEWLWQEPLPKLLDVLKEWKLL